MNVAVVSGIDRHVLDTLLQRGPRMDANGKAVGFLVVGVGGMGAQRAAAATVANGCRLVAVVDCDEARAHAVAARHGVAVATSLRAGLELPGVDAVVIATPHSDHAGSVRSAMEVGKSVLCEKPLAIDAAAARNLAEQADAARVRLATGFNHRFDPPVRDALRLVNDWSIGRVEGVRAVIGHKASAEFLGGWHADVARSGGGSLMDHGPHACDLIRRFLGEVVAAQGLVRHGMDLPPGCESEAFALFRDHDRGIAELRTSWAHETGYLTVEVRGSLGSLRVETAPWRLTGTLAGGVRIDRRYLGDRIGERAFRRRHGCQRSLVRELEAFVSHGAHPRPGGTGWDGCRATEMIQAVYRSEAEAREVALDPLPVPPRTARPSVSARGAFA